MKPFKSIMLIVILLLIACGNSNKTSAEHPENWLIDANGVGIIQLGGSISEIKNRVSDFYKIQNAGYGGFTVEIDPENLINVSAILPNEIGVIQIYSNHFKTKDGITVGMTIREIEDLITDFSPEMDESNGRVFFAPKEFQSSNRKWVMHFSMPEDKLPVCPFEKIPDGDYFTYKRTGEMNKDAVVQVIQIYTF